MQHAVALGLVGEVARDVLQHQHEPGQRGAVAARVDRAHRRHLHPQQLAGAGAGDELRRRMRGTARQPLLHALQRMRHQGAVEHGVDRPAQAQQLGAAGQRRCAGQGAELGARAAVVEQDAAVQVAHHHALRQLGHQRGQAVALLLDAAAGFAHLGRDVGAQRVALAGELAHGLGQRVRLGAGRRLHGERAARSRHHHAGLFGQARGAGHPAQVRRAQRHAERARQQQPAQQQQRAARLEHRHERGAFAGRQRGGEAGGAGPPGHGQHRARRQRGDPFAAVDLHGAPSSSRTLSASSRVAKGLVM